MKKKIVVAIDGSPRAPAVLSWALDHADPTDEVVAISVWNLGLTGGFENPFSNLNQAQIDAAARVNTLIERVTLGRWDDQEPSVTVRADVRHGDTATELVDASEGADLLVLGNCHYDKPGQLGAVAKAVLYGANCAVVLVPINQVSEAEETMESGGMVGSK